MRQSGEFGIFRNDSGKAIGGFFRWRIEAELETRPQKGWMSCQVKNWQASIAKWWIYESENITGEFYIVKNGKPILMTKVKLTFDKGSLSQLGRMMDSILIAKKG